MVFVVVVFDEIGVVITHETLDNLIVVNIDVDKHVMFLYVF